MAERCRRILDLLIKASTLVKLLKLVEHWCGRRSVSFRVLSMGVEEVLRFTSGVISSQVSVEECGVLP